MAKKRKSRPKVEEVPKEVEPKLEQFESEEDDDDDEEEEVEEVEESSSDEDDKEDDNNHDSDEEEDEVSKRDTVRKLLQPFGKDQLIDILKEAGKSNRSILDGIIAAADSDPVHRKIFVHGLGWDTTSETLISAFKQYGQIEEGNVVADKVTGRSKGYGFVLFKKRAGARKALKEPQKKIGNRMAACQLASFGPIGTTTTTPAAPDAPNGRKLYVANVGPQVSAEKLRGFFAKFGEIEEGPLGFDKVTGKFRGFALIIYKTAEGIKKALEEPLKVFEGCKLQCSRAVEGRSTAKANPTGPSQGAAAGGGGGAAAAGVALPTYPLDYNQGLVGQNLNPAAVFVGQNPALGVLNPMLVPAGASMNAGFFPLFAGGGVSQSLHRGAAAPPTGFGAQPGINTISPSVIGSYGSQAALQGLGAYHGSQMGQPSASAVGVARSQSGIGSVGPSPSYFGR